MRELKKLWGKKLFNFFNEHIDEEGWLTSDWGNIVGDKIEPWDKKSERKIFTKMYLLELENSECGKFIRPIKNETY